MRISSRAAAAFVGAALATSPAAAGRADVGAARGLARSDRLDEPVDVVQVDGDRLYHLEGPLGLLVYDVADPVRPRLLGRHAIVGSPVGVIVRGPVATIVMGSTDARSAAGSSQGPALARAIDVTDPSHLRQLAEWPIEGDVSDARATESALYVVSRVAPPASAPAAAPAAAHVVVTALPLDGSPGSRARTFRREGSAGAIRAVDHRLVFAHADAARTGTHVDVLVDPGAGALTPRGSIELRATIAPGDRDGSARIDATDAGHVRVLGCPGAACAPGGAMELAVVDATDVDRPRVSSVSSLRAPGPSMATRFDGSRLYASRRGWFALGSPSTPVTVVDIERADLEPAAYAVEGVVWNLVATGPGLLVIGTRGDAGATDERVFVDMLDVRDASRPTMAGEVVVEGPWASSPAQASTRAVAVCGGKIAIPYRAWDAGLGSLRSAVVVFDWGARPALRPRSVGVFGFVERLACVRGRLLAVTDAGLWSVDVGRGG